MKLDAEIKEILWKDWDPIGVNDSEEAKGEYDNYSSAIVELLDNNANKEAIKEHLLKIETQQMGLQGHSENADKVADKILSLKKD